MKGVGYAGVGSAVSAVVTAVAGTTFAAPMAIGAGVGLVVWGVAELVKSKG